MTKRSLLVCLIAIAIFAIPSGVFAAGACDNLTIAHIGVSGSAPSGVEVYFKNESGKSCTDFPANTAVQTYLSTSNTDQMLAILLTAASLGKKVWVYSSGSSAPYTIAFVQSKNIAN